MTPEGRQKGRFLSQERHQLGAATSDKMIRPPAQRSMSKRAGATMVEVNGSHAVYVSKPEAGPAHRARRQKPQPIALEALREKMRKLPETVFRAKGVVNTSDVPERRAVLHVVGRRVDISIQDVWGGRLPRTQIVAIGAAGGVDASLPERTFAACIATRSTDPR